MSATAWTGPGTAQNIDTGGATWASTSNALSSNNVYATCDIDDGGDNLYVSNFGFSSSIPTDAEIDGVEVKVHGYSSKTGVCDVFLTSNGSTALGSTLRETSTTSETEISFGSSSTLWGATLTDDIVNATAFGVSINFPKNGGTIAYVDYVEIRITYTGGAGGGAQVILIGA